MTHEPLRRSGIILSIWGGIGCLVMLGFALLGHSARATPAAVAFGAVAALGIVMWRAA